MTLFDWLNQITFEKKEWSEFTEEDRKSWNTYMIFKYLSMNRDYIEFINDFQKYQDLSSEHLYIVLKNIIPQKKQWLKYIKSSNKEPNKELLKIFSNYFECSIEESKINLKLLSKEQINDILMDISKSEPLIEGSMKSNIKKSKEKTSPPGTKRRGRPKKN